jgi:hypothetical protein
VGRASEGGGSDAGRAAPRRGPLRAVRREPGTVPR